MTCSCVRVLVGVLAVLGVLDVLGSREWYSIGVTAVDGPRWETTIKCVHASPYIAMASATMLHMHCTSVDPIIVVCYACGECAV